MGHLRLTIGYLKATVVHIMVTLGHLMVTLGHLRVTLVHLRVTLGHLWVTLGKFFSISNHKANTTELHPKVRKTCYGLRYNTFAFSKKSPDTMNEILRI